MKSPQQVDSLLLSMLNGLPYFSRLGTCLCIRLADYASQLCGFRSSRQVDECKADDVSDQYNELIDLLYSQVRECTFCIDVTHTYKPHILELNDSELELLLESTLFEMTIFDCHKIFAECFLDL